jgi:hypothetical protein
MSYNLSEISIVEFTDVLIVLCIFQSNWQPMQWQAGSELLQHYILTGEAALKLPVLAAVGGRGGGSGCCATAFKW